MQHVAHDSHENKGGTKLPIDENLVTDLHQTVLYTVMRHKVDKNTAHNSDAHVRRETK